MRQRGIVVDLAIGPATPATAGPPGPPHAPSTQPAGRLAAPRASERGKLLVPGRCSNALEFGPKPSARRVFECFDHALHRPGGEHCGSVGARGLHSYLSSWMDQVPEAPREIAGLLRGFIDQRLAR